MITNKTQVPQNPDHNERASKIKRTPVVRVSSFSHDNYWKETLRSEHDMHQPYVTLPQQILLTRDYFIFVLTLCIEPCAISPKDRRRTPKVVAYRDARTVGMLSYYINRICVRNVPRRASEAQRSAQVAHALSQ